MSNKILIGNDFIETNFTIEIEGKNCFRLKSVDNNINVFIQLKDGKMSVEGGLLYTLSINPASINKILIEQKPLEV